MRRKSSIVQTSASQFVFYCMQRGPITTNAALLELLGRCGEQTVTTQDLKLFADIWSDSSGQALGKGEFMQLMQALKGLRQSGRHYIGQEAATELFFALSSGGDVLSTICLRRVLRLLGFLSLDVASEFFSAATFWGLVSSDGVLAQLLLEKLSLLLEAAAIANSEGFHPAQAKGGDDDEDDEIDTSAVTAELVADEIGRARQEIAAAAERSRAAALLRQQNSQPKQKISYFSPQLVTEMFADVDAELPLMRLASSAPELALEELDRTLTSQVLVARVGDLRKHRVARDERREARQRRSIQHAAYEASQLHLDGVSSDPSTCLRDLSFLEGIGEKSAKRLYPHQRPPQESIRAELATRLGVELPPDPSRDTSSEISDEPRRRPSSSQFEPPRGRCSSAATSDQRRSSAMPTATRRDERAVVRDGETAARNEIKGFFFSNAPRVITPNYNTCMPKYQPPKPTRLDRVKQRLAEPSVVVVNRMKKQQQRTASEMSGLVEKSDIFHRSQILLCDARDALRNL